MSRRSGRIPSKAEWLFLHYLNPAADDAVVDLFGGDAALAAAVVQRIPAGTGPMPDAPPGSRAGPPAAAPDMNGHGVARPRTGDADDSSDPDQAEPESGLVPIQMEGDGPLILREKVHAASPMTIDQALLQMELVGHDFYLFHDRDCDRFSVVYRRRGYDYGVIRLVEE